jgi:hypothetical protein
MEGDFWRAMDLQELLQPQERPHGGMSERMNGSHHCRRVSGIPSVPRCRSVVSPSELLGGDTSERLTHLNIQYTGLFC